MLVATNEVQKVIDDIIETRIVRDAQGKEHPLHSNIDRSEGELLCRLIEDRGVDEVLEIGCAFGMSSLFLHKALSKRDDPRLVIVDPYQEQYWFGIGKANLDRAGCSYAEVVVEESETYLPTLVKSATTFDFALIDGAHDTRFVFPDFFNVDRLLRPGGLVVFDDSNRPAIQNVVDLAISEFGYRLVEVVELPPASRRTGPKARAAEAMVTAAGSVGRMAPGSLRNRIFRQAMLTPEFRQIRRSSMVVLEKVPVTLSGKAADMVLFIAGADRARGLSDIAIAQKFGITVDHLHSLIAQHGLPESSADKWGK